MVIEGLKVTPESAAQISAVTFGDLRTQLLVHDKIIERLAPPQKISLGRVAQRRYRKH